MKRSHIWFKRLLKGCIRYDAWIAPFVQLVKDRNVALLFHLSILYCWFIFIRKTNSNKIQLKLHLFCFQAASVMTFSYCLFITVLHDLCLKLMSFNYLHICTYIWHFKNVKLYSTNLCYASWLHYVSFWLVYQLCTCCFQPVGRVHFMLLSSPYSVL